MRALKTRLAAGLSISLVVLLGGQFLLVSGAIRGTAHDYIASRLQHDAETLLTGVEWTQDGPRLDPRTVDTVYQRAYSGHYYRIRTDQGTLHSRSLWDGELPKATPAVGEQRRFQAEGPAEQPLLVYAAGFRKDGNRLSVVVAEDLSALQEDVRAFQWRYGLVSLGVALALIALQWLLLAVSMRPLDRVRRQLASLEAGERTELSERVPREVQPLVREVNHLLMVTAERLQRSRNATANLAHALKTPLTRIFQVASDPRLAEHPALREQIEEPATAIRERIEREQKRARLAGGSPGQRFDTPRELGALAKTLERMFAEQGIRIETELETAGPYQGDREDLLELFGNLLENACKWAESRVRVAAGTDDGGLVVTVEDDGPGVPPEERTGLTQRGRRLDEATPGHGLGLSIAADIAAAYGGEITFGESALGGLQARVRLPTAVPVD